MKVDSRIPKPVPSIIIDRADWDANSSLTQLYRDAAGAPVVAGPAQPGESIAPARLARCGATRVIEYPLTPLPKGSTVTLTQE